MVLPIQHLRDSTFGKNPMICAETPIRQDQIQISSVDCRLKGPMYRIGCSALPQEETVAKLISRLKWYQYDLGADTTHVLEKGATYIFELEERLALAPEFYAEFSPKSSTGRCDVFVRVLTDRFAHYDKTKNGYNGPLYAEVTPLSFNVRVKRGLELTQFRIRSVGERCISGEEIAVLHAKYGIMRNKKGRPVSSAKLRMSDGGLYYHIDLKRNIVGFESVSSPATQLDLTENDAHNPVDFWRPIYRPENGRLILTPGVFYLLVTKERTVIPPEVCGQMLPYEVSSGEIRPHYAGFFDNGFGGEDGTTGVLEVRCRDMPFEVSHGQPICKMDFFRTLQIPEELYSGNYTRHGPSLSKHFKRRYEIWR